MVAGRVYRTRLTSPGGVVGRVHQVGLAVVAVVGHGRIYRADLDAPGSVTMPSPSTVKGGATVVLTGTPSGSPAASWEWEVVSGPSVGMTGEGDTRTFLAPYLTSTQTVTVRARATIGSSTTDWATTTVTISKHPAWARPGGVLKPLIRATPTVSVTPSDGLWFQVPSTILQNSKKVFAHYFGPYPRSINNAATIGADNYAVYFNNPGWSTYSAYGSMFRDRPLFRAQLSGDYKAQDCAWDIQQAKAAGIDGFAPDLLGLSGTNYDNYESLRAAALAANAADPTHPFYVMPMVDANGATAAASAQQAAAYVKRFCIGTGSAGASPISSAYFTPTGKFLFSAFKGEGKDISYWQSLIGYLQSDWGIDAAFMPCYVNWNSSASYTSIQYGSGSWGYGADPAVIASASNQAAQARARGEVHFAPIAAQDIRPGTGAWFDEALNTGSQRAAWTKAIAENSEYAQIVTWSDFSETAVAPSAANGWSMLDLHAWYISRWKTGNYPTIARDAIILSHRSRTIAPTITGGQTTRLTQKARGTQSSVTNNIEVLTFLPTATTVRVTIGGTVSTYTAPAGMGVRTYPVPGALAANQIAAEVVRGTTVTTTVTSPVAIKSSAINDDYGYYRFSSIRGTAGQFDPSTAY